MATDRLGIDSVTSLGTIDILNLLRYTANGISTSGSGITLWNNDELILSQDVPAVGVRESLADKPNAFRVLET